MRLLVAAVFVFWMLPHSPMFAQGFEPSESDERVGEATLESLAVSCHALFARRPDQGEWTRCLNAYHRFNRFLTSDDIDKPAWNYAHYCSESRSSPRVPEVRRVDQDRLEELAPGFVIWAYGLSRPVDGREVCLDFTRTSELDLAECALEVRYNCKL